MRKTSIYSWFGFILPMAERFRLIKAAGFDSVFLWWGDEFVEIDGPKREHPDMARNLGLAIENVHLPFSGANDLWLDGLAADSLQEVYLRSISECAGQNIPTVVLHLTEGENPPGLSRLGLDRIGRLVELAEKKSVNIALENLRKPEFLKTVLREFQSDRLGFCFDSGHQHCRTKEVDYLSLYGSRLMALHLHDNDESGDQHQVPGEGTIDWDLLCEKLKGTGYAGAVALEVTNEFSPLKEKESPEEFLIRAHRSAAALRRSLQ
jgi:sugar phosphate isomerase/epimerase